MANKRQLRASGLNDYVSVDLIDETGNIIENVFYFEKNKLTKILFHDNEERKWVKTNVCFDGEKLICVDVDEKSDFKGMEVIIYPSDYGFELCDKNNTKPLV